ncbi:MAG: AAA family ATPase [Ruminococcus sp.]|nr:AAA family ATPase [Ruminococcus sp.]
MLYRKIYKQIEEFYNNESSKALMITGARQVGKSFIIEEFCKSHFQSFIQFDLSFSYFFFCRGLFFLPTD